MRIGLLTIPFLMSACGALNTARPLDKGEHRVGVTGGGAVLKFGTTDSTANLVVEGQSGLSPYKVAHSMSTMVSTPQRSPWVPLDCMEGSRTSWWNKMGCSLTLWPRDFTFTTTGSTIQKNLTCEKPFSWICGLTALGYQRNLGYVGVANYLDIADPELTLAPFAGDNWTVKKLFLQAETRYLAINRQPEIVDVPFATFGYGALSITGGFTLEVSNVVANPIEWMFNLRPFASVSR